MGGPAIILLTRPIAQSERFAALCHSRFGEAVNIVVAPLMEIRAIPSTLNPGQYTGLIFTSENAVEVAKPLWPGLNCLAYAVGPRTGLAAEKAGYKVTTASGNVDALYELLVSTAASGPLLHLRGANSAGALAERLGAAGIETDEAVIYDQVPIAISLEAECLLKGELPVVLPLFSPRSATIFWQDRVPKAPVTVVAMSQAVAAACGEKPDRLLIAEQANANAMLDAVSKALG